MNGTKLIAALTIFTLTTIMIITVAVKTGNAMHDLMDSGTNTAEIIENLK